LLKFNFAPNIFYEKILTQTFILQDLIRRLLIRRFY